MDTNGFRIERFQKEIDDALEIIRLVEVDGMRLFEGHGQSPLVDVTDQRVAACRTLVDVMRDLIRQIEAINA
jgi:hypothetical protein